MSPSHPLQNQRGCSKSFDDGQTDYCATLPSLICRRLMHDPRLKILPAPVDLGSFPVEMAWHVRYRHDPAHRWLRGLISEVITDFKGKTAATAMPSPA